MHPMWFVSIAGGALLVLAVARPKVTKEKWFLFLCVGLGTAMAAVFVVRCVTVAPEPPLDFEKNSLLGLIVSLFRKWLG